MSRIATANFSLCFNLAIISILYNITSHGYKILILRSFFYFRTFLPRNLNLIMGKFIILHTSLNKSRFQIIIQIFQGKKYIKFLKHISRFFLFAGKSPFRCYLSSFHAMADRFGIGYKRCTGKCRKYSIYLFNVWFWLKNDFIILLLAFLFQFCFSIRLPHIYK